MDIAGRAAIVTGGASSIGRSICLALADAGTAGVVGDVDERWLRGMCRMQARLSGKALTR